MPVAATFSDFLNDPVFRLIQRCADRMQQEAYVVGGYVRDCFLERPCKDIDVVVVGKGIPFAKAVAAEMGPDVHLTVFKNFGTAMLHYNGWEVEFVGARKESYDRNSRKPAVEDGTLHDDQQRRDFTINALALCLNGNRFGELLDSFGGMQDLNNGVLRTPLDPDVTFSDDPLRMMRAIRFSTQLGFQIETESFAALARNAHRISIVSMERIIDEMNKIISAKVPSHGFKLLFDTGILHLIFPQLVKLQVVETIGDKSHKDNFYHTLEVLDKVAQCSDDLWLRWAAILHDIAKPQTKRFDPQHGWTFHGHEDKGARMVPSIFRQLKLPMNEKMKFVQKLVALHLRPIVLAQDVVTDSAVRRLLFDAGDDIDALMTLCRCDITSKNPNKVRRFLANFERVQEKLIEVEEKDRVRNWQPPITGEHIMHTFGIGPGPAIGILKNAIRDAILDGRIENSFALAHAFMLEEGKALGLFQAADS